MDKKALKRWEKLLEAYFCNTAMSEEWREKVRLMLFEEPGEEEKFAVLERYFDQMMRYDTDPDSQIISSLEQIKTDLGFSHPIEKSPKICKK